MGRRHRTQLYLEGIQLFNEHEYFDAHEAWEDLWHMAYGISTTSTRNEPVRRRPGTLRRSNPRGVVSLFKSYRPKFEKVPPVFMGLDVTRFLAEMHETLRPVLEANPLPEKGQIQLDLARTPKIELSYDPFANGEAQRYSRPAKF